MGGKKKGAVTQARIRTLFFAKYLSRKLMGDSAIPLLRILEISRGRYERDKGLREYKNL